MKKRKKTVKLAKADRKELIFAGASSLLGKPEGVKAQTERKLIVLVSRALGINPFGVNILGSLPYVNNIGRKDKLQEYSPNARFEYNWIRHSENDSDKAICEAWVVSAGGKRLSPKATGEASPATIPMRTLQGYQNHLAQTRAENRAFEAAFGVKFRKELMTGIQRELQGKEPPQAPLAEKALSAAKTSYEEVVGTPPKTNAVADYDKALALIAKTKDKKILAQWDTDIKNSKLYDDDQKGQLRKLIEIKLA